MDNLSSLRKKMEHYFFSNMEEKKPNRIRPYKKKSSIKKT